MALYEPYHTDAYLKEIEATVANVREDWVALDKTVFYARGGGQPSDRGVLLWDCDRDQVQARVVDVRRDKGEGGGRIWHRLEGVMPSKGQAVRGSLDWERRYALMRAHTALHILCGVIWRDYRAPVTGAEMDVGKARMDFEFERMSAELAAEIEAKVNTEIEADREVRVRILPREEAERIPDLVRNKVSLVPKEIDRIRVVEIVGLDLQADGGTHVASTAEVGRVKIVSHKSKGRINKRLRLAIEDQ